MQGYVSSNSIYVYLIENIESTKTSSAVDYTGAADDLNSSYDQ